jgi:gas vesicle protein
MNKHTLTNFLIGVAIGAIVSLIIGLLFTPASGQQHRDLLKTRFLSDRDWFSARIRVATDEWVGKLRQTANEMVSKGYISPAEAEAQIHALLEKVRG